jgi:molecular chaperone DnaK (HSP70)
MSLFDKSQRIGDGQGFIQNESTSEINPANLSATNEQDSHNGPQILGDLGTFFESNQQELSQDPSQIVSKRFSVGIDLGTTHCVVSYAEIADTEVPQQVMAIPQLILPGTVEDSFQLPSFLYQAHEAELAVGSTSLPWTIKPDYLVGEIARNLGSKTPIRLVSSAKSWLCHAGVDCKSPILPVNAPEEVERISPFQATTAYLQHIRDAWQTLHPSSPLDKQDLVITVPASFDPAARELTVEAARVVGLEQAILLEEPQAALYSWIEKNQSNWRSQVTCGDIILVIDVGGGTTDLSLIAVTEKEGNLELIRVAVGDHILLGGDNMDLALAYTVKAKLEKEGKRIEPWQLQALTHSCRDAKEKIFNNATVDTIPIVVASRGSSLMSGNLRTELTREEVTNVLVEGFFPKVAITDRPANQARGGLRASGLPYAQDAAISRHLAAFLAKKFGEQRM